MSEPINSRSVAEHLCTLATLLEAEAMKARVLGLHTDKRLGGEAHRIRELADRLWQANATLLPEHVEVVDSEQVVTHIAGGTSSHAIPAMQAVHEQPRRRGRRSQMKLVSS